MIVFEDVDIEFYSIKDQQPNDEEEVIIVLKLGVDSGNITPYQYGGKPQIPIIITNSVTVTSATYIIYKTRPNVFRAKSAYRRRTFTEEDIICWGRLQ